VAVYAALQGSSIKCQNIKPGGLSKHNLERKVELKLQKRAKQPMSSNLHSSDLNRLLLPRGGTEIPIALQCEFISGLWNDQITMPFQPEPYAAFFGYFKAECESWQASGRLEIVTCGDLLDLVRHLQDNRVQSLKSSRLLSFFPKVTSQQTPRNGVVDISKSVALRYPDCQNESVHNSLCLAVRIWLMIDVGAPTNSLSQGMGRSSTWWTNDESINQVISRTFPKGQSQGALKRLRWPKRLNARSLERVGGFEISWTSNLAEHLCIDEESERISLFHHARFLQNSREVSEIGYVISFTRPVRVEMVTELTFDLGATCQMICCRRLRILLHCFCRTRPNVDRGIERWQKI
jgi:hypothetical protein